MRPLLDMPRHSESMARNPRRVCIIGAGAAGLATAHTISRAGIPFDWFEAGSKIGGIWRYGNDTGASIYASLITNTPRSMMEWFGYPMPNTTGEYLTHHQVLEYLENFAAYANLQDKVTVATQVTRVQPLAERGFRVAWQNRSGENSTRDYGAVIVAVGCHSTPKWPNIPGILDAPRMHASEYRTPEVFAGKRVVVAGFGASGVDIACDAVDTAMSVVLAARSGGYILPRYVGRKTRNEKARLRLALAPLSIRKQLWRVMLKRRPISPKVRAALEERATPFAKPAVLNDRIAECIENDQVLVRPGIASFAGDRVVFSDGSSTACDLLVCATGYKVCYPFFPSEIAEQNRWFEDRFLRVVSPNLPGLYFVGGLSVVGPFFPVFERQAAWVADLLTGRCALPSSMTMKREAARESRVAATIFPDADRQRDVVEYYPYVRALDREHAAGLKRASGKRKATEAALSLELELTD